MSEKPQTGPFIKALAIRMERACLGIQFIGNDGKPYKRDYEEDARWYVAYQITADMRETYTTKDWAYFVLDGMQPLTDEDVREWFFPEDGDEIQGLPSEEELRKWLHG